MQPDDGTSRAPMIYPLRFWVDYRNMPDGSTKEIEMVEWQRRGTQNQETNQEKISRLIKLSPAGNPCPEWQILQPYYDKWKKGQEMPVNGTPLGAWPHATQDMIAALVRYNIKTVEDIAELEDQAIARVSFPGFRRHVELARAFLKNKNDRDGLVHELTQKDQVIGVLQTEVEDQAKEIAQMKDMLTNLQRGIDMKPAADVESFVEIGKRRGRPPGSKNKPQDAA
jgi:hypothetical protein